MSSSHYQRMSDDRILAAVRHCGRNLRAASLDRVAAKLGRSREWTMTQLKRLEAEGKAREVTSGKWVDLNGLPNAPQLRTRHDHGREAT